MAERAIQQTGSADAPSRPRGRRCADAPGRLPLPAPGRWPTSSATMLYPIAYNIRMSLEDVNVRTFLSGDAPFVGFDNYRTLIDDPAFRHAIGLSLIFTAGSLLFQFTHRLRAGALLQPALPRQRRPARPLPAGLAAADRRQRQRLPLDARRRLRRHQLRPARAEPDRRDRYWLIDPDTALAGTILANIWVGIPFNMVLLLAGSAEHPADALRGGQRRWRQRLAALPLADAAADAPGLAERAAARASSTPSRSST